MQSQPGFSLLELLIVVAVLSITLAIALPSLGSSIERREVSADAHALLRSVNFARQSAINEHSRVVLCPLDDALRCTRDWSQDLVAFVDRDRNNALNAADTILRRWNRTGATQLSWRGFGSGYLRFLDSGFAAENGSFTLCPPSGRVEAARQLVVNRVGRAYLTRDTDGDGIVEYGRDAEPVC